MLTREELRGLGESELNRMLTERTNELAKLRRANGDTFANIDKNDPRTAGRVRHLLGEVHMLGEAIDAKRGARDADARFRQAQLDRERRRRGPGRLSPAVYRSRRLRHAVMELMHRITGQ